MWIAIIDTVEKRKILSIFEWTYNPELNVVLFAGLGLFDGTIFNE